MIRLLLSFIFIIAFLSSKSQKPEYNIKVIIQNNNDSTLYLAYYFGNKIKPIDTAYLEKQNTFIFKGNKKLPGGIYMVVNNNKAKLFEFVINQNQKFSLKSDSKNYSRNLTAKNSKENKLFFDYLNKNDNIYNTINKLNDSLKNFKPESKKYINAIDKKDSLYKLLSNIKKEIIEKNKDTFVATLLKSMEEIQVPETILINNDSSTIFWYYKNHYWDNFDLNDSRLLRTPIIDKKIKQYFKKFVAFKADSVIKDIDKTIKLAGNNNEVVSYLVWYYTSEYQDPKYMGFDKVFVHLVDNYFKKRKIDYTTPSVLSALEKRAETLRPLLIGKKAPNLIMTDTAGRFISFYTLNNDYTILLFWDYNCSVCKHQIKKLKETLKNNKKYDIEIFAININSDLEKWKETIKERGITKWVNVNGTKSVTKDFHDIYDINSTPVIYILDKNKVIIAKQISTDMIIKFLDFHNNSKDKH
jgi:peroxiredoxin